MPNVCRRKRANCQTADGDFLGQRARTSASGFAIVGRMKSIATHRLAPLAIFVCAATLEVVGDAIIRSGLRGRGIAVIGIGCVVLAAYGVVVNQLELDFSRLMGAYVAVFALVSILIGRLAFHDRIRPSTWTGLAIILIGGAVSHFGFGD